ncbi:hypothetical protein [uncultured Methanobrevibacter sp.]|uniref:hypothetical protein n=1 Tax=uncultured Methanobrevibacter sp. TaxID=253161 RepID=UPI0025E2DC5A|nr:hypothetical protein [uncultured Methanobrevibacter sp.]
MSEIEVNLKNEIGSDLGSRQKIEKLFKNINTNASKVIMNFEGVEFMGRSFAQEYLNQKHIANYEITEINLSEDIKKMFNIILELNNRL